MDVLSESLRRATEAAPPTRIDVDALIAGEHRRRRVLIGGSVTGMATAGVAIALLAQVLTNPGTSGPAPGPAASGAQACVAPTPTSSTPPVRPTAGKSSPDPSARPADEPGEAAGPTPAMEPSPFARTEPVDAAERRISLAFAAALWSAMPGVPFVDGADPNCPLPQVITFDRQFPYESAAVITDAQGRGDIVVHLYRAPDERPSCDACGWHEDLPGGALAFGELDNPGRVDIWRPDGTGNMILAVDHRGDPARTSPPATRAQMIAIGAYPALSVNP
jgi:hypothetical protein